MADTRSNDLRSTSPRSESINAAGILKYIRENNLPPIVAADVNPEDQFELFRNLIPVAPEPAQPENFYQVFYGQQLPSRVTIEGQDYPIFFKLDRSSYSRVDRITDYYQERERLKSYSTNRKSRIANLSVDQLWYNPKYSAYLQLIIDGTLQYCLDNNKIPKNISISEIYNHAYFKHNLMAGIYYEGIYTSQYRVTWVVSIISFFKQFFKIESILDPFAGWGDRLIGAIKLGIRYHGFDPNTALHPGYQRMISDLADNYEGTKDKYLSEISQPGTKDKYLSEISQPGTKDKYLSEISQPGTKDKYLVEAIGFEDWNPFSQESKSIKDIDPSYPEEKVDLAFTSPPYGPVEIYSQEATQSIIKFGDNWFDDFYLPSLLKAWSAIREGGLFILHICDTRTFYMVDKTMTFFNGLERCIHLGQFMAYTHKSDYPNLHLVYQKSSD